MGANGEDVRIRSRDNSSDEEGGYEGDYVDTSIAPLINIAKYNVDVWESDHDLVAARHLATESFRQQWEKGIQAYISGKFFGNQAIFFFPFLLTQYQCLSLLEQAIYILFQTLVDPLFSSYSLQICLLTHPLLPHR